MWVLASVAVALVVGFLIGRSTVSAAKAPSPVADSERQAALATLVELLRSVETLTADVDHRNTEMRAVRSHAEEIETTGELETVRQALLAQVATILVSNQKLEDDLGYARCRMEEQAQELDRTRREASTDALSGVANRKGFDERLVRLLGDFKRGGDPFVLVLADMDHFKWINDTHGHQAGDNVLRELGELLRSSVREGDIVARYGGDEFALLLPKIDLKTGIQVSDRIRKEATKINFGLGSETEEAAITLSMGLAMAQPGDTPQSMIERADQALYASKRGGRNQVHFQPSAEQLAASQAPAESPAAEPELAVAGAAE
jgi:diguanylate cyclase